MIITNEMKNNQEILSPSSRKFLEFVEKNPDCLNRSHFKSIKWIDPSIKLQPWPTFVSQKTKNRFKEAALSVGKLIKTGFLKVFKNDSEAMSQFYEVPSHLIKNALTGITEKKLIDLLGRGDFILSSKLEIKCVEYNLASNLGGWQLPIWESMYQQHPSISRFIKENNLVIINENLLVLLFEHLIKTTLNNEFFKKNNENEINLIILMESYIHSGPNPEDPFNLNSIFQFFLRKKYPQFTGKISRCRYADTQCKDGYLYYKDKRIYTLLRYDITPIPPEVNALATQGSLSILNGNTTIITANKLNLALLSQNEDSPLFTPEEKNSIKNHIPWTRKVETGATTYQGDKIFLEDFIPKNKDKLILKPARGSGGEGVHCGFNTSQSQWRDVTHLAFSNKPWVVQEYVEPSSFLYQYGDIGSQFFQGIWGCFMFGTTYGGMWLRILPSQNNKGVINSRQGAEESIILEVNE